MPVYEYLCEEGHEFEVEQNIHASPVTQCMFYTDDGRPTSTKCKAPCKRLISKTSFKFKGGPPTPKGGVV
jgi:putative FmdB family regulatory protein